MQSLFAVFFVSLRCISHAQFPGLSLLMVLGTRISVVHLVKISSTLVPTGTRVELISTFDRPGSPAKDWLVSDLSSKLTY